MPADAGQVVNLLRHLSNSRSWTAAEASGESSTDPKPSNWVSITDVNPVGDPLPDPQSGQRILGTSAGVVDLYAS